MERDWIDYVSAVGSIATAATLFLLFVREWKTRKDVTDLKVIAKELNASYQAMVEQNDLIRHQMKVQAQPIFVNERIVPTENKFIFQLRNIGEVAFISSINCLDKTITIRDSYNSEIRKGNGLSIFLERQKTSTITWPKMLIKVEILYRDAYWNFYDTIVIYENNKVTLHTATVVSPQNKEVTTVIRN